MKFVINIADSEADSFMELLKSYEHIKAKRLSTPDAAVLEELSHIRKAFRLAGQVKSGKIKSRPASELFNEL